jgi:hypothetical protein
MKPEHRKFVISVFGAFAGILALVAIGMTLSEEQLLRKSWKPLEQSIQGRDRLIPNVIYLIKTNPGYPDIQGAATLFRAQKTCENFDTSNTQNYLAVCVMELETLLRSQQSTLTARLAKSSHRQHWSQLSAELDKASSHVRAGCREIHDAFERRPFLTRPLLGVIARHDWSAFRVCR